MRVVLRKILAGPFSSFSRRLSHLLELVRMTTHIYIYIGGLNFSRYEHSNIGTHSVSVTLQQEDLLGIFGAACLTRDLEAFSCKHFGNSEIECYGVEAAAGR